MTTILKLHTKNLCGFRSYTELCERTRKEAFDLMIAHAQEEGANAIISMRYDANEVLQSVTEVLAYGTAAVVEKFDIPIGISF